MNTANPFLRAAIEEAERGLSECDIPIGSVVHSDAIVGRGRNRRVQKGSVILHGEMDARENAGRRSAAFYRECTLYTTLLPCAMCRRVYRKPSIAVARGPLRVTSYLFPRFHWHAGNGECRSHVSDLLEDLNFPTAKENGT